MEGGGGAVSVIVDAARPRVAICVEIIQYIYSWRVGVGVEATGAQCRS